MEQLGSFLKFFIAIGGSIVSFLYGGLDSLLMIFTGLVVIDYVSGLLASSTEGKLSSQVGFKGIAKKIMIFALIAVAHFVDQLLGNNHLIRDATIFFYMANELLSIIENAGRLGIPIPGFLKNAVNLLRNKSK
ncbi:phage holin family protein [Schinkia azotoformans]|uniref:Toxin secretion/phage lysis holin n=2 Tax=Schinkia azotoformans TaxID=1454 RepID=K6D962_SCHAZ|nr:phage holin family protein [Schinkia azotoformans]EKN64864.1 toxin secretion/phage lysis holin [Schinkia azotoformans LMG 9581]MEC1640187.1 phage holin family protein [Schinkia azotoformans]MEC1695294.1 phage holin family protein [Schinkia azotoformans]MEC1717906.1 phage holin family protein [Schinkia azotoformans]MEC1720572.1 phage holin family protein [Schinkia azotoformans]